jgi:gamma-glutamylputrescine oxidase
VEITYGEPNTVRTAKGVVRAKYLLIAGNAYLPQGLDNRVTARACRAVRRSSSPSR